MTQSGVRAEKILGIANLRREPANKIGFLASYETLLPMFDGDERRTILYLQHVMGTVLKRPYEVGFKALSERKNGLDAIEKACRAEEPFYGAGWDT